MTRHAHYSRTGDRGAALLIAVAALSLVALVGAVLLADAQSEIRRAERLVDRTEGDHLVEIAVAAAWAEIVDGASLAFEESGAADTGTWTVRAAPADDLWVLSVEATTDGDVVTGRITVSRDALVPYTLVVDDAATGPLRGRVAGRIGIHGEATFSGRSLGDLQELIGPAANCTGCDNPVAVADGDTSIPMPTLPPAPCPDSSGTISGALPGGFRYECTAPGLIVIDGVVTADGPVVLFFADDVDVRLDNATVHVGGAPADFLIHTDSSSASAIEIIDSQFHGMLDAPDGRLLADGFRWEGTVVVHDLRTLAGSELTGTWSDDLATLGFGGWRVTEWDTSR